MSVNKVILVGRLGKDPELRYSQSGKPMATWSMATGRRYKDRDGEWVEQTQWHNIKVFGPQAESCEKYLEKGRQVYVEGRLEVRDYDDRDGVKKRWTEVVCNTVQFLGRANGSGSARPPEEPPLEGTQYADGDIPF